MKSYNLYEVFTPSQPASLTFIERKTVAQQFLRALKTPGKQLIIYGHSGSGKTTFIKKKLEVENIKSITTQCMKGMLFNDIVIDAFDKLDVFYNEGNEKGKGSKLGGGVSANYFGIKASINAEVDSNAQHKSKRAVALPITPQTLGKYLGEAKGCWILEDFHKMDEGEKIKLSQTMKIFMDLSSKYKDLKIIAIGAVNTAREVVKYDPEMKNRVAEIYLPLMSIKELEEIIIKGNRLLNFNFSDDVIEKIATYSSGLASVTHQLSLLICSNEDVYKTCDPDKKADDKSLDAAIDEYVNESSDSLKHIYDLATKCKYKRNFETPEAILNAMLKNKKDSQTTNEIAKMIKQKHTSYKENNLRKYLNELTTTERGEILRYDKDSDKYSFSTPFIKAYAYCILNNSTTNSIITKAQLIEDLKNTLHKELEDAKQQFFEDFVGITEPSELDDDED